ncbi:S41 family peptidase [Neolewinella lacunae]|uniref:Tricorn protease homolog n=1 Tax=Neolewinella lacunae TaxID=1517758 RepID=A0A923PQ18_9BACT|nr:S41 family peptidase [Neolewinella lacunae]MBC6995313.1 PD40 domain-containing protein [Neolewinella lacunae]MDN3633025.1 S41 family peptidase [Neolewinella lacunae]
MRNFLAFLLLVATTAAFAQSPLYFPSDPALTPDGKHIVFAYSGDLWKVATAGGRADRLTALDGAESHPRISPDGKWLAFSAAQYGNDDVYVTSLEGGPIRQLTFHDANDQVANWSWDSQTIYFASNRYNRGTTFGVSRTGGTPVRQFEHYFNTIHNVAPHPKTGEFYFNESWESSIFAHRRGYRGPFNPDIKSFDAQRTKVTKHTAWEGKDLWPMIDRAGKVYFVSDRDNDTYNLYLLEGKVPKPLTKFPTSVFTPSISADGQQIVFVRDYQLEIYDVATGKSRRVSIELNAFPGLVKTKDFNTDGKLEAFDVARDGKKIAFVSRGSLFVSDAEGKFIQQVPTGEERVAEVRWLKDDRTLLFTQTLGGYQNLYTVLADGSAAPVRRTNDTRNNRGLEISKDSSRVVYLSGRDEVRVMDLNDFSVQTVAKQEIWAFQNSLPRWSPDDRYILFTGYLDFEQDLFLVDTKAGNRLINLTNTGVTEADPVWSPDGKYIYFTSARHQPNYPRGGGEVNLYRLPLKAFDAPYAGEKFSSLFADEEKGKGKKDSVVVEIDFANLMERMETVGPRFGTQSGPFVVKDGAKTVVLYGSDHAEGKTLLYKTVYEDFEAPKTELIKGSGVGNATDLVTAKGKHYVLGGGKLQQIDLSQNKLNPTELKHTFRRNLAAEFRQMYYETWANLEENFYSEDFHGVDWPALRDRYAAYLPHLTNRADLRRLTNDLLGELNTSHFGFNSSGSEERTTDRAQSLALGLEFSATDPYLITGIIADGPADRAGIDLRPGDRLVAIDGERIDPTRNREAYLSRPSVDKEVALTQVRGTVESIVRLHPTTTAEERNHRYDAWVDDCQRRVDEQTEQRVAYIHMKNMGGGELDNFLNEMVSEGHRRDALILDLRYNTGGNVHDAVLQFLQQKPYLRWKYRGGAAAAQPNFAPSAKPIVLLINEQSLSDAEMTTEGFKQLGLGTVMGTPTYRWIIFTSGKGLVDGSFYRLPSWGCYALDGRNLEKTGVEPDIRIDNTAADRQAGRDPQLDAAIREVLRQLK